MMSLFDLSGKVALVTGASRGIGKAIALQLAEAGARVAIASNERAELEKTSGDAQACGYELLPIVCDVSSRRSVSDLVDETQRRLGAIEILVCNAGVAPHVGPVASATDDDWDLTMTVNVRSVLWLTSLVIPGMAQRREGSVIITSSIAGLRGNKSLGLYSLSKAGAAALARNLAVEWGPSNVRVNSISPGLIRTDFARVLTEDAELLRPRLQLTPLRRVGEADEIAGVAVMLASPAGAFMTGQNLVVDGGTTIGDGN